MKKTLLAMSMGLVFGFNAVGVTAADPVPMQIAKDLLTKIEAGKAKKEKLEDRRLSSQTLPNKAIKRVEALPITGLSMIEDKDGTIMFVSDNGRYVFQGTIVDIWSAKEIKDFSQVEEFYKIPVNQLNFDYEKEFVGFKVGNGEKKVVIFIDPFCPHCKTLLNETYDGKDDEYKDYSFHYIYAPLMGQKSQEAVIQLYCNEKDMDLEEKIARLNERRYKDLVVTNTCKSDLVKVQQNYVVAKLFGINAVPYLIAPNGTYSTGVPKNLSEWLTKHDK